MGKKGKRRWEKSQTQQKKQRSEKKTPEMLANQGNLQEAIRLLRTQISINPSDEKKSLLGHCLFDLGNYQEAVTTWLDLSEKTAVSLALVGAAFINIDEWEQACRYLDESLQLEERSYTWYLLALARRQDRHLYRLDQTVSSEILRILKKALSLPGCPAEAFLLLDDILQYTHNYDKDEEASGEDEETLEKLNRTMMLQEAFTLFPENEEIRLRYVAHLYHPLKNYEAALMVVAPLIAKDEPHLEALAYALVISIEAKLFEKALQYAKKLQDDPKHHGSGIAKVKGDLLLALGKFGEAFTYYEQEIRRDDFVAKFIGIFSCAWTFLLQGQSDQALKWARQGADFWFVDTDEFYGFGAFDSEPIRVGGIHVGDDSPALHVKCVCERLLQDGSLDAPLKGKLSYLLYLYYDTYYTDRRLLVWEQREEHSQLLLQAEQLFPHPYMSGSLASHHKEAGDLPCAVKYHLDDCLRLFESDPEYFVEEVVEFECEDMEGLTGDERSRIHETAFARLQECQDVATIQTVFLPFYRSFWHEVLFKGEMFQTIVDVTTILIRECSDTNDELWNYAYAMWQLGNIEEAERAYRECLEGDADNENTYYNLSLILEQRGLFKEALSLCDKALALVPDDEMTIKLNARMKEDYKRREEQDRKRQEQEMFLRTVSERWKQVDDVEKRLLYVMTKIERWEGWLQLATNVGIGEQELHVHWKKLIELGMIISLPEDTYRINPYVLHFVKDEGLLLHHPVLTTITKAIADIETAEALLKEMQADLQATVLNLSAQVGDDTELRDKLIWHLYWRVERVQQTWLKKAFSLKDKELREITTKAWVKMTCPTCNQSHMVNVTTRSEYKRVQDNSWQQYYAKCPSCKEAERQRQERESNAIREAKNARQQELHTMPYRDYLQTPEWQERRKRIMKKAGFRCQICDAHGIRLNVHHRTYERRGYEDDRDLITLCEKCHTIYHQSGKLPVSE